ncbi:type II toxin-antitoxin system VapB family antitoxin [Nocardiopsis dassonvillei]|uniref:type II toxin-antitoxin system VapB family antitoxin n=1 Tax=Nocardiopsis dassonvillei TaxID=2014 RepID=UPI003F549852
MVVYPTCTGRVHHHEAATALTRIDIDDEALQAATGLSGARTGKETVDPAPREYAARHSPTCGNTPCGTSPEAEWEGSPCPG